MTSEELTIMEFLRSSPENYFARREIARRAVKRSDYEENPHWADAALASLLQKQMLQQNDSGQFRIKKDELLP